SATLAGAATFAGNGTAAPARRRSHPPPGGFAAGAVSRSDRAARHQRPVVSRHRRSARRPGRDGDVAACPRPPPAARALDSRTRIGAMNCSEAEVLIHALIDGELDAGHAHEVEAHAATCRDCAGKLAAFRDLRRAVIAADLKEKAPASLRARIEAAMPL